MKIGLFEAGLPNCSHDAGSTAIVELCTLAKAAGHEIEYIFIGHNPWGRADDLKQNNIPYFQIPTRDNNQKLDFLKNKNFDCAIISRPGTATEWLHVCNLLGLPVIYFGHDIHYKRMTLGNSFLSTEKKASERDIKIMKAVEHNIWKQAKALLYPSEQECEDIKNIFSTANAFEIPIYDMQRACDDFFSKKSQTEVNKQNNLFFAGGYFHLPNYDAMIWFAKDVLPNTESEFTLHVVGDWPEIIREEIRAHWNNSACTSQKIEFTGRLSKEQLYERYRNTKLVITPLRFGAGVKRKVVESTCFKIPVLGTKISYEGLDIPENLAKYLLSEINAETYAIKLDELLAKGLYQIKQDLEKYSDYILKKYSDEHRKKVLEKAISMI